MKEITDIIDKHRNKGGKVPVKKLTPLLAEFNKAVVLKYEVSQPITVAKGLGILKKCLESVGDDTHKLTQLMSVYVEDYDELPFTDKKKYPVPTLGGLLTFLPQLHYHLKNGSSEE